MVFKLKEGIMDSFDRMVNVLISPEKTFQQLLEDKKAMTGIFFYIFFAAFLGFMTGALVSSVVFGIILAVLFIIIGLIKLIIWSGISHIIARVIFGGKGHFGPLLGLFGYMSIAFILGIIAIALMVVGSLLSALLLLFLMVVWMCFIALVAVDAVHEIGVGKSFLSIFGLPTLIIIVIFVILGVL
jgi:hypothetical protein